MAKLAKLLAGNIADPAFAAAYAEAMGRFR